MKKLFCAAVLAACAIAAGCSSSSNDSAGQPGPVDDAGNGSDGSTAGGDIAIPATNGTWAAEQDVSFSGKGAKDLGEISITHGAGTIQFKGAPAQAIFYNATPVPTGTGDAGDFSGQRDFQIIAAQDGRLIMTWFTCDMSTNKLGFVYYESTDGDSSSSSTVPGGELPATGTCTVAETPTNVAVSFPAVTMSPPPLVSGFTITGADLSFDGTNPGSANVIGESWKMYPFNTVDCSDCATPGWYELHSLFYDPSNQNACLGILYLLGSDTTQTELAYLFCLNTVTAPLPNEQKFFDSTWTSPKAP